MADATQATQTTGTTNTSTASATTGTQATTGGAGASAPATGLGAAVLDTKAATGDQGADTTTATTDAKTTDTVDANKAGETKTDAEAEKAIEYTDFKTPEGVQLDKDGTGEFKELAKSLKLPQEEAQKVFDLGIKIQQKMQAKMSDTIKEVHTEWATNLKNDKQLGGEKLAENLGIAQRGLNAYDTNGALTKLLTETGLANNVDVVRAFYNVGLTVKPDTIVQGNSGGSIMNGEAPGSLAAAANILYGGKK